MIQTENTYNKINESGINEPELNETKQNKNSKTKNIMLYTLYLCGIINTVILIYFSINIPYQLELFKKEFASSIEMFKIDMEMVVNKTNTIYDDVSIFCNKSDLC